jgi:cytochrome c oxidase assembly protein subunit 15
VLTFRVSPTAFKHVAHATLAAFALVIVTGGAVRLTGSGLGCPDWPTCYQHGLTAAMGFHPMVEFVNRCLTIAVTVLSAFALVCAIRREPRRDDLVWLAAGEVIGIVAQIIMGGLVVLFKLNPYLVMAHFLLSMALVGLAVVLWHRAGIPDEGARTHAHPVVGVDLVWLGRLLVCTVAVVITAGTAVTGAGPHAGDPSAGVRRIPVAFRDVAELHSTLALFLIGMTLATLFALHAARAPLRVQKRGQWLLEVMVVQATIGFTQYFLHDNPLVVGIHMAGATAVWISAVLLYLSLFDRRPVMETNAAMGARTHEQPEADPLVPVAGARS